VNCDGSEGPAEHQRVTIWRSFSHSIRARSALTHAVLYVVLCAGSLLFLGPLGWTISTSLKPAEEVLLPNLIPGRIVGRNYVRAMTEGVFPLYLGFWNSIKVVFFVLIGVLLSNTLIAYGFARLRFPGRDALFLLVLATMMLPGQVTMIPLYVFFSRLKWTNTYLPLIVPSFFGGAFFIFLLRQYYMTIPHEIDDAAKIDGCGPPDIYWRIILPLSKPAIATMAIFTFIWTWSDYFGPLLYLNRPELLTLAVSLTQFRASEMGMQTPWHLLMAGSVVAMLPQLLVFFFAQELFIEGITLTGMKG
jgi:ABC-type glycerol-3-phosphate transport system permease component